jgi:hypothetical protein
MFGRARTEIPPLAPVRFTVTTPPMPASDDFAVSPDGRRLAFVAPDEHGTPVVWVRQMDGAESRPVADTNGASRVFFAPGSDAVAFIAGGKLRRLGLDGGATQDIADVGREFFGGAWLPDGSIVFGSGSPTRTSGLSRVSANGGPVSQLTELRPDDIGHALPMAVEGGKTIAFAAMHNSAATRYEVCAVSSGSKAPRCIAPGIPVGWLPPNVLVIERGSRLVAVHVDPRTFTLIDEPVAIVTEDLLTEAFSTPPVRVSSSGVLAFRPGGRVTTTLTWFDRHGTRLEEIKDGTGFQDNFELSADGTRIAVTRDLSALWILDFVRGVTSRLVGSDNGVPDDPVWSPDGLLVAYTKRTGRARVVVRSVADGRERVLVESPDYDVFAEDWSRDGRFLAVGRCGRDGCGGLVVPATGGEPVEVVHGTRGIINDEYHFAPDGRWLAYNSDESGRDEVYVAKLPPTGERVQVSSNGGVVGRWRRDGRELFYLGPDGAVMSIDIQPGEVFKASAPRRLFTTAIGAPANELDDYAVSADGQRFLIPIPTRGANVEPINVIVNWSPFARSSMGR